MESNFNHLSELIDFLQARGKYFLTKSYAAENLNISEEALRSSIKRLVRKKRLARLKQGLYLIVPIEYMEVGAPPPDWFINSLMQAYGATYYVGLLTAAALHGAAHQQPQVYQIITDRQIPSKKIGRARIKFYFKKNLNDLPTIEMKTTTGYMRVSTPELTAFDLVEYLQQSGHINHVSTVLSELGEEIDPVKFATIATQLPKACLQRTGYILDYVGFNSKTVQLHELVSEKKPRYCPLRADRKWNVKNKDEKWRLYVNEILEPDL